MNTKLLALLAAAGLVVGSSTAGLAKNLRSMNSPGHKMQRFGPVPGHPGASGYAPGHLKQARLSRHGMKPRMTTGFSSRR